MGNVEGVFAMRKVTSKYFRRKYVKKNRSDAWLEIYTPEIPTGGLYHLEILLQIDNK